LHLGHVVNAIHVWESGAEVVLRIEDHDRQRSRTEYEETIREDLAWLGFVAHIDAGRQSDRGGDYDSALDRLRAHGLVYACACTRSAAAGRENRYPGTCANKGVPEPGHGLRVRLARSVEPFVDRVHGAQEQIPSEQCGDLLVRDRLGNWTYQFCAVVDDMNQGITLVIRGDDLLPSTGRQIQLARMLGRAAPLAFMHHALLMKAPTRKLSKSDGATGIRELRAAGWTREQVIYRARAMTS
jgi:glutamyl/glutaminyl-tRNA synthetase